VSVDWEAAVRAVPHDGDCTVIHIGPRGYPPCTCSRDARIAKGIEAALQADGEMTAIDASNETCDAAALAAFKETP
jgi:hypothetical protein